MLPLVSILMPVFNTNEIFLREAISSILLQTYSNIKLIIIDDCSTTTDVAQIVESFHDPRIIFIKNKVNLGIPKTRNILLDNAQGQYIAFLDSDDIALPNRIKVQVQFLEKNLEIGVVGSNYLQIPMGKNKKVLTDKDDLHNYTLFRGSCFCNSTTMIRNNIIQDNKIRFNEEYALAEDYGFWAELIKYTNFANINEILVHLRVHGESITRSKKDIMKLNTAKILASQWVNMVGDKVKINENIIINFILGKKILLSDWQVLEEFLITLLNEITQKFSFYKMSRKYLARYFKKYILKVSDYESLKYLLRSKMPDIFKIRIFTFIMITLKLIFSYLKKYLSINLFR